MKQYAKEILISLIDKYERSKVSDGNNQIRVSVKLATEKIFPKYLDNELFELREKVNEAIEELISKGWIVAKRSSNYTYSNITLPQKENVLSQIYLFLGREKKSDRRQKLTKLFTTFMSDGDETVEKYCKKQLENLEQNKAVEFFNGDYEELKSVLECCIALKNLPQEMYYRNFSVKQFGDSKKFEILQGKISSLLFKYGNFSEKESVFDELGLLKTPSYIHIKGNVRDVQYPAVFPKGRRFRPDLACSGRRTSSVFRIPNQDVRNGTPLPPVYMACRTVRTEFHRYGGLSQLAVRKDR